MISTAATLVRSHLACVLCLAGAVTVWPSSSPLAQTISIVSVEVGEPDLGTVASAANGDTVFRIAPATGVVTKQSGAGARVSAGTTRGRVHVTCTGSSACASASATVTISQFGSPTGRARALDNFTIAGGVDPPTLGTPSGTSTISFTVSGIPEDATRDFYVGADFGIGSTGTSGLATAGFLVSAPGSSEQGTAQATVLRPLSLNKSSDLSFGSIMRPSSGSGTVTFDSTNASRQVTGAGALALNSPPPTLAQYSVSGEGGQAFSIDVNGQNDVAMTGPGMLSVTLNDNAAVSPTLDGSPGGDGSYEFRIGGMFEISHDTPIGTYSGTFLVTVNYN